MNNKSNHRIVSILQNRYSNTKTKVDKILTLMSISSRGALVDIGPAAADDDSVVLLLFLLDIIMAKARPEPRRIVTHPAPIRTLVGRSDDIWLISNNVNKNNVSCALLFMFVSLSLSLQFLKEIYDKHKCMETLFICLDSSIMFFCV
jgi:hypothetical protein